MSSWADDVLLVSVALATDDREKILNNTAKLMITLKNFFIFFKKLFLMTLALFRPFKCLDDQDLFQLHFRARCLKFLFQI